ncbi:hypothetical protein EV421DRAFT_1928419 [Armillaria borealis]|uniref:Uncharacterized protein n=1 Tax=Armillaria borealis TaxID=47425 RepID=A0AA39MEX9_9AGAR|nr:hypothetical protein EV421DRAFT_1928419 [Armillaria borealis]
MGNTSSGIARQPLSSQLKSIWKRLRTVFSTLQTRKVSSLPDVTEEDIVYPKVTISAFSETGEAESSIKVLHQRSYTGRKPVMPSPLADTPCATLGIQGVLDQLNTTLGTSRTVDTPSVSSLLEDCIEKKYDLALHMAVFEIERREALVGNRIVDSELRPRRVWDLYSNRVVPCWINGRWCPPISHAWVYEKDRVDVWTRINGEEWPVPIPKDASLNLIRTPVHDSASRYGPYRDAESWTGVHMDVLCLGQKGGPREDLRAEEWKLDVPTIGHVYHGIQVAIYLSGLGRPMSLKEGDLESDRCWFRRAWTLLAGIHQMDRCTPS